MGKPNLLRRRSKSSDGRPVSSLVSPSSSTSPSSSSYTSASPPPPRQSSQGPPNFFYQDPTNRAYSPQSAPPSSLPLGPNAPSPSSSSSPSRLNQFLSPHGLPQPPQFPSSLRQPQPMYTQLPPRTTSRALPGAPPLLAPPPPSPSHLLSPKTMTRSGGSSTSLSSDVSGGSGFSSFKDEEVEDLADDEDFVLPVGEGKEGNWSSDVSLAPPPLLSTNLRSSSQGSNTTPATSVHSRDTSPQQPRHPSSSPSSPSKATALHGRTPSGSLISAAPMAPTSSQQDSKRSKLPPLTTEFVSPKHDFFADTAPEESWEARGRRYEEAAAAALMSPQSTYSQASPALVSRRVTNGGRGVAVATGRGLWGADVDDHQPRSPELDLRLSTSFSSTNTNGQALEPTSPAPLSPLPSPRNPARPVSSLRTSRPLGSPTKLATTLDQDRDHPLPPPPRYTSPPPQSPNNIYSPLTPTPSNQFSSPFGSGAPISSSSSVAAPFKQDYTSSASFNILPKITASSSTTFGNPSLMSHFGEDAFNSSDILTLSSLLSTPRVLRGILQELPIQSVLTLWEAGSKKERRAMDGGRYVREEVRVWGLGWAGYMRGGLDRAGAREGWANVSTGTILDFLSTLSLPPNAILPPHLVLASSVVTLLLRTSHSLLPPPGPHLIPFEEEDCLPVPLLGLHPSLPPSARTRALPNGRELVFPAPLASAIDLASPNSARSPSIISRQGSTTGPRKLRRRSSISSVMSGVTWGATRAKGGAAASMPSSGPPPSSFNNPRIVSSSASIHSTAESPSSSTRVTPPTPRAPEPRRYEFSQNHPPPRNHRRPTNDSRLSLDSSSHAGGGGSSIYSNSASFIPRQRSATGPVFNGWRGDANESQTNLSVNGGGGGGFNQGPSFPVYYDPDAPPMPNLANPAFKKHGSRESSMLNLSHRSGSSQSPSGTLASGTTVPLNNGGSSNVRPRLYSHRPSSPESSRSSNPSFPNGGSHSRSQSQSRSYPHQRYLNPNPNQSQINGPVEPLFLSSTSPFRFNRAPVLRIVVPLPANVSWPSGAALKMCHRELDASGLLSKMRFGDLVENLCVSWRRREEGCVGGWASGAMVFIPPFLHPLSTSYSPLPTSSLSPSTRSPNQPKPFVPPHLPPTMDSFLHSPTYYHAVLPLPYIIFLDLLPFGRQIFDSLRLANQRTELPSSRGEILSVDVWIHEAAFTIPGGGGSGGENGGGWGGEAGGGGSGGGEGMEGGPWAGTTVILESDGTKEGKDDLLSRISGARGTRRPWEILGSKSTSGSVWLKLVRESTPLHEA